jgi:hypothetical protein
MSTGTFGPVSATAKPGIFTVTMTGDGAGTASLLSATIEGVQISDQQTVTVAAGPISGSSSTASFEPSTIASGAIDTLTLKAADAAGNAIDELAENAFAFKFFGGTSTVKLGPVTPTATPGTYAVVAAGVQAGSALTLSVKINGVLLATEPTIQVTPGPVSAGKSTISLATPTVASGKTDQVTIIVKDAAGNAVTGLLSGDFILGFAGGTSTGSFGTVTESSTAGTYKVEFTAGNAGTASYLSVEVMGVLLSKEPKATVTA